MGYSTAKHNQVNFVEVSFYLQSVRYVQEKISDGFANTTRTLVRCVEFDSSLPTVHTFQMIFFKIIIEIHLTSYMDVE